MDVTQQQAYQQVHAALAEFVKQGGKRPAKALTRIELLREIDPETHAACEQLIKAGAFERAIEMLSRLELDTPALTEQDIERMPGSGAATKLSWASAVVWVVVAAICWLVFPGVTVAIVLIAAGWVLSIVALSVGGSVAARLYEHYSGLGEYFGALVFLLVPVTLPIGVIWTVARALRIGSGTVDGPGHDPSPGGGYARFERGDIGPAGRPIARALLVLALGHPAALAGLVAHSGVLELISISSN